MSSRERPAWAGSTRRTRLPADWPQRRADAARRNPQRICHWCGRPGGTELDHIVPGDDHSPTNLDWIHARPCHAVKSAREGAAARPRLHRPPEDHPAFG